MEPDVIVTRVVGNDIDHDLNTGFVEGIHHDIKVGEGTDFRVDISVVGNVIYSLVTTLDKVEKDLQPPSLRAEG